MPIKILIITTYYPPDTAIAAVQPIYGLEKLMPNYGYISREESAKIQTASDIFRVLSWNTKAKKGILTGKFYEGIRAKSLSYPLLWEMSPLASLT